MSLNISLTRQFISYALLLLLVPIVIWSIGWQWHLGMAYFKLDYALLVITEMGSLPYAIFTSISFTLILIWITRKHYSTWVIIIFCLISISSTQLIKSGIKSAVQAPRPFVHAIFSGDSEIFYQLPRKQRASVVLTNIKNEPDFIVLHQAKETGYSFPSGHTIFATSWLLLLIGFCLNIHTKAVIFLKFITTSWAILMLISRLRFGMHYPIDLFTSIIIALGINWGLFQLLYQQPNLFHCKSRKAR